MQKDAVVVTNLTRKFKIPHERKTTIFEHISGIFSGKRGYEEFEALKNINFSVRKGEAIGIIGENGSGKSTLLKIIAHILRPSSGSVEITGKITSFLELGVGFQPDLTARENIYLYGTVMGMSEKEIKKRLEEILEFAGLKRFEDTKLKNLSSGMQVRLAFSTAIQTDPEILLMDEVLAVGDMEFQQKCMDVFQGYIKKKKTILFVSHDMNSVRRFCSKALLLRHGEQVAFGKTNEIIDKYVYGINDDEKEIETIEQEVKTEEIKVDEKEPEEKKTRWGDKKVEIIEVKFIDKFGKENNTFFSGDPVTVKINYDVNSSIDDLVIGIALYSSNDLMCFGTNTEIKEFEVDKTQGNKEIRLKINSLTMIDGKFYLTVAAHSKKHIPYDWLDRQFTFDVMKKESNAGIFEIPCNWEQ